MNAAAVTANILQRLAPRLSTVVPLRAVSAVDTEITGARQYVRVVVVQNYVGHHHRDVVGSAATQRQFDQTVATFSDIGYFQRLADRLLTDWVEQPVRAQQEAITWSRLQRLQRRELVTCQPSHHPCARCGGQSALIELRSRDDLIPGDLIELSVAEQIGARRTDVR